MLDFQGSRIYYIRSPVGRFGSVITGNLFYFPSLIFSGLGGQQKKVLVVFSPTSRQPRITKFDIQALLNLLIKVGL